MGRWSSTLCLAVMLCGCALDVSDALAQDPVNVQGFFKKELISSPIAEPAKNPPVAASFSEPADSFAVAQRKGGSAAPIGLAAPAAAPAPTQAAAPDTFSVKPRSDASTPPPSQASSETSSPAAAPEPEESEPTQHEAVKNRLQQELRGDSKFNNVFNTARRLSETMNRAKLGTPSSSSDYFKQAIEAVGGVTTAPKSPPALGSSGSHRF